MSDPQKPRADTEARPERLARLAPLAGLAACLAVGYLALAGAPAGAGRAPAAPAAGVLSGCPLGAGGYLEGSVFAGARLDLDWRGPGLACAGNARAVGSGLRLFFAGRPAGGQARLVLVIGISGGIDGLAGAERAASVTLVDEAQSAFFHGSEDRCFTRVGSASPLAGRRDAYRVEGELYCVGAIPAVTGHGSVTLGDTRYAGLLELAGP